MEYKVVKDTVILDPERECTTFETRQIISHFLSSKNGEKLYWNYRVIMEEGKTIGYTPTFFVNADLTFLTELCRQVSKCFVILDKDIGIPVLE